MHCLHKRWQSNRQRRSRTSGSNRTRKLCQDKRTDLSRRSIGNKRQESHRCVRKYQNHSQLDRLERTNAQPKQADVSTKSTYISSQTQDSMYEKKLNFKQDIDVRGMRGDEALQAGPIS